MVVKHKDLIEIELPENTQTIVSHNLSVFQWDKGQKLKILNIADGTEVQFGNDLIETTLNRIIMDETVEIPDIMITYIEPIKAYVKIIDENSETTIVEIIINVIERTKPDDYIYPEDEQSFREQMEAIMQKTKDIAQQALDKAEDLERRADSGEFNGKDGKDGEDGINGRDGVDGKDGENGITPTIGENGNWYLGNVDTDKPSRGEQGVQGEKGEDGYTPIKGKDYFTENEIKEIEEAVTPKDYVRTVNGIAPDYDGNVEVGKYDLLLDYDVDENNPVIQISTQVDKPYTTYYLLFEGVSIDTANGNSVVTYVFFKDANNETFRILWGSNLTGNMLNIITKYKLNDNFTEYTQYYSTGNAATTNTTLHSLSSTLIKPSDVKKVAFTLGNDLSFFKTGNLKIYGGFE